MNEIILKPIGFVHSSLKHRHETPRQGVLAGDLVSFIELVPSKNYEQALLNLEGIERIWIIFWFHKSEDRKLMVTPPRNNGKKVGVFASRAPHRPNPIGLSCVKLLKVEGLKLFITESDILDNTPVLDIKPYLPYADSFPDASTGWIKSSLNNKYEVVFEPEALKKGEEIKKEEDSNLINYARIQLQFNPEDVSRKRIDSSDGKEFVLSYREWKIFYSIFEEGKRVIVYKISV